jgi:16S rRNA (guanine527-N7)-methyltransferase
MISSIAKYFPTLSAKQLEQYASLQPLYEDWNQKINVISRNDIQHLYERHVLFSLAIVKVFHFKAGTTILDVGTGGGFPGIPLAIFFPDVQFYLVDSIGKKIKVVEEVVRALDLKNVTAKKIRSEEMKKQFDFVVSRALTALPQYYDLVKGNIKAAGINELPNGIIYLAGGEIEKDIKPYRNAKVYDIKTFFEEPFFETKKIIYIPRNG